jgi:2-polyprenyl-3-methyl-5-hydroxy-6-metoxy-1,4-benzoquinol methylase/predicted transcriptional regulator
MNFSQLMALACGHVDARIVQTGAQLAIFETLQDTALSSHEIGSRLGLEPKATEILLNALASMGLLEKERENFSLTEVARRYLLKSSGEYLGGMIRFDASLWSCWEKLPEAIRSGKPVRTPDMYQSDPNETEIFIEAMDSLVKARGDSEALATALDWTQVTTLLDVGAGPATYPIALCRRFLNIHATIFDLPGTLRFTERHIREAELGGRIELISGDYRSDPIPGNYDVIFLSNIIHGENVEKNIALVKKLAAHLNPGGQIVIKDHILDESRASPPVGAIFSVLMLLTTDGGRCYSFAEIRNWLESAGLKHVRQIDLPPPLTSSLVIGARD